MKLKRSLLYLFLAISIFVMSLPFFVNQSALIYLKQEGFLIEMGTALMFFFAGLILFFKDKYNLGFLLFLATIRELDLHRFLGDSFLKKSFYTGDTDLKLKIIGAVLILIIATIIIRAIIKYLPYFLDALLKLKDWAILLFFSFGFIFVAKLCDESNRFFRDKLDMPISKDVMVYITYVEESLEFLAGILILMSIAFYFIKSKKFIFK